MWQLINTQYSDRFAYYIQSTFQYLSMVSIRKAEAQYKALKHHHPAELVARTAVIILFVHNVGCLNRRSAE